MTARQWLVPTRWRRVNLLDLLLEVDSERVSAAAQAAKNHAPPIYPGLAYTETQVEWVLLYEHIQRGQLHPAVLRRMRRTDLEYVAGHPQPHPDLIEAVGTSEQRQDARGRAVKIVENVTRATRELERRTSRRNAWATSFIAAAVGGAVGSLVTYLVTK